jgi:hypothetical protein
MAAGVEPSRQEAALRGSLSAREFAMIMLASVLLAIAATPAEDATAARTAWTSCTDELWPQTEAGVRPATAANTILDYCKSRHDAWVAAALRAIDSGPGTARQKAAQRRAVMTRDNGARARLIRLITEQRRRYG